MAYIQDTTQSFTIALTALLEGLGNLVYIAVTNLTIGVSGEWNGTWISPIPPVTEGNSIEIYVEVENEGATTDTLFAEFISAQVTPAETLIQEMPNVDVNSIAGASWNFIMPPNNVSITINAGHIGPD